MATTFPRIDSFLKVENVELFIYFWHYGNLLLHELNSHKKLLEGGNYSREETICGNTVFVLDRFLVDRYLGQIFGRQIFREQIFKIRFSGNKFSGADFGQFFYIYFKAVLTLDNIAH